MSASIKSIKIPSNGIYLDASLVSPDTDTKPFPIVLTFHGMTSSKDSYVKLGELLSNYRISTLAVSLQGHGQSEGDFAKTKVKDLTQNGRDSLKFLKNLPEIDNQKMGVLGTSVGSHIAACISNEFKSIILRVPGLYNETMLDMTCEEIMNSEKSVFNNLTNLTNILAIKSISTFKGDLLIVTSENDSIIPAKIAEAILNNTPLAKSKRIKQINGADHGLSDPRHRQEFYEIAVNWFRCTL